MKAEIRKLLGTDRLLIGTERVLKALRRGELAKVVLASNCSHRVRDDVHRYAGSATVIGLDVPNEELGVYCKKPFNIQVLGIRA